MKSNSNEKIFVCMKKSKSKSFKKRSCSRIDDWWSKHTRRPSIGEYQQIYDYVFNKSTIFFPSSISSIYPLYFLSLSLSNNYYNRLFFALLMNGLKDHSMSASSWSTVPNFSWYNRNSNLGPISFKCKDFGPFGMS